MFLIIYGKTLIWKQLNNTPHNINSDGKIVLKSFWIAKTTEIAIIGTPILPKIKKVFRTLPCIKNPKGKASNITARNLKEIKLAISESEKEFFAK